MKITIIPILSEYAYITKSLFFKYLFYATGRFFSLTRVDNKIYHDEISKNDQNRPVTILWGKNTRYCSLGITTIQNVIHKCSKFKTFK